MKTNKTYTLLALTKPTKERLITAAVRQGKYLKNLTRHKFFKFQ